MDATQEGPHLMAEVIVHERGQPDVLKTLGPYSVDPDDPDPQATLERNLRDRDEDVVRVFYTPDL